MDYTKEKLEELRQRWETKKGKNLIKIIKESRCYLSPVLFKQKVRSFPGINDSSVRDGIDLRGVQLSGFDFRVPIQEDDDGFAEELAILSEVHFEGAILKHCTFQDGKIHNCFFENADLSHTTFAGASLSSCNFQEAECAGMNLHGTKLINCNFRNAIIRDMTLDATIIDEKSTFGKTLKSEKEKNYHIASIEYKQIKQMYKSSTLHSIADHYHHKEMTAKRKAKSLKNPMRWTSYVFGNLLCKYGTSFIRVAIWSTLVVVICAFIYTSYDSLHYQNGEINPSFLNSLYFSIVTFTTLGYGDFHAIGQLRFLAAAESVVGSALMALFTVIVARNIIRD